MGLDKKMKKIYTAGFVEGCRNTWDLIEQAINRVEGIGPKRQAAILEQIQIMAREVESETMGGGKDWRDLNKQVEAMLKG